MLTAKKVSAQRDRLLDPTASEWGGAQEQAVALRETPLASIPSVYIKAAWQGKKFGNIKEVKVRACNNGSEIFFLLEWHDPTENVAELADSDTYPDAAGIMFPLKEDAPILTMGSPQQPVNAWQWRPDYAGKGHNNVATGLGSTRLTASNIVTRGEWKDSTWRVVIARALKSGNKADAVQFEEGKSYKVGFAVWDGQNGERNGIKAFSAAWQQLTIE